MKKPIIIKTRFPTLAEVAKTYGMSIKRAKKLAKMAKTPKKT